MENLLKDLKFGWRSLRRAPAFTIAAVLAVALGIGSTTAIFSVLDGVVLKPLPFADPERLVAIWEVQTAKSLNHEEVSPVNFADYRGLKQVFTDAAAWWRPEFTLTAEDQEPIRVSAIEASGNFFSVLGVQPMLGSGFDTSKFFGPEREVVISHRLWQNRFQGDRSLVGKGIRMDGQLWTVAGIMNPTFDYPRDTDVWQRLRWDPAQHTRAAHFMEAVGRLAPGATVEQANNELRLLMSRFQTEFPQTNKDVSARTVPLRDEVAGFFRPALFVLIAAVGLLLLIACINVANLLLARATSRAREVTIRAAIGASRTRLIQQFLAESLLLSVMSAIAGIGLAYGLLTVLIAATPIPIPRLAEVSIDARVLGFATALAALTALIFGLIPALFVSRPNLQQALKGGKTTTGERSSYRMRNGLVVAEVALAVMLLVGAGLLIRTLTSLMKQDPGFRATNVLSASVQLTTAQYPDFNKVERLYSQLMESLALNKNFASVGATNFLPLETAWRMPFLIAGQPRPKAGEEPMAQHDTVSEGYFQTMGIPLIAGRDFNPHDTAETGGAVLVNRTLAQRYFANENPVGKSINSFATAIGPLGRVLNLKNRTYEIIGIVGDVKNQSLRTPAEPAIYHTHRQFPFRTMSIVVRGNSDTATLASFLRDAVREIDPSLPLSNLRTVQQIMAPAVDQPRFLTYLMSAFAMIALLLATLGIHGVLSYAVNQRQQEISIRMALGAQPRSVVWLVMAAGLKLTFFGVVIGLGGGYAFGRAFSSLLFGVQASDAASFTLAIAIALATALAASFIPARFASRLDPLRGLRIE